MKQSATGVVLLNMGGPETLDDVPAFLFNLFSDREIIRLGPRPLQKIIAWIISRKRAPKSIEIYQKIGGGSPLRRITEDQASHLQKALHDDGFFLVRTVMRYWHPRVEEVIEDLLDHNISRIIALPLYPHYSRATTGSSLRDLQISLKKHAPELPLNVINSWPEQHHYISALKTAVQQGSKHFSGEPFQLVYSAHSLPVSFINEGDPYVDELNQTIKALEAVTNRPGILCYQSRSGPVEWLSPETTATIKRLAEDGWKNILMVPISFVSDHVETLYEIDMLFKEQAAALGVRLEATPSLNTSPDLIAALHQLVLEAVNNDG